MRAGEPARRRMLAGRPARGFTYIALLAIVAMTTYALALAGARWTDRLQRDREQQLLRVGELYAEAIQSYYRGSPGSNKVYPRDISDLLLDPRMLGTVRHLRAAYTDPIQPGVPLAPIRAADGTLRGVRSTSVDTPFLETGVDLGAVKLEPARRYADWLFIPKVDP